MLRAEPNVRLNAEDPAGPYRQLTDGIAHIVDILEQVFRVFQIGLSGFGERQSPGSPIQQPDPEIVFQRVDLPRNAGGREARLATGTRQATDLHNAQKELHCLDLVHYCFGYRKGDCRILSIMFKIKK